jgi:tripartite-type tricarboxylate transporter receptor subunit TctC
MVTVTAAGGRAALDLRLIAATLRGRLGQRAYVIVTVPAAGGRAALDHRLIASTPPGSFFDPEFPTAATFSELVIQTWTAY